MLDIEYHNLFRKDYKKYLKNGFDSKLLDCLIQGAEMLKNVEMGANFYKEIGKLDLMFCWSI